MVPDDQRAGTSMPVSKRLQPLVSRWFVPVVVTVLAYETFSADWRLAEPISALGWLWRAFIVFVVVFGWKQAVWPTQPPVKPIGL